MSFSLGVLDVTAVFINKVRVAAGVPEGNVSVSLDGDLGEPRAGPGRRGCTQANMRSRKGRTSPIGLKERWDISHRVKGATAV